jgi:hypothetical protein
MKDRVSGRLSSTLTWLATGLMALAALALIVTTLVIR